MTQTDKKKDDGRWFIIIMLIGLTLLIIFELQGLGKDPELTRLEGLCQPFCEEKGLYFKQIGLRQPCGAPIYEACLICMCYRKEDIAKQPIPYSYTSGNLSTDLLTRR